MAGGHLPCRVQIKALSVSLQRTRHIVAILLALVALASSAPASAARSPSPAPSHDATHPTVMQQAAEQVAAAAVGPVKPLAPSTASTSGSIHSTTTASTGPTREVFGFALASSLSDPTVGYPSWNFSLLSTVAFFGLHVNDDGTIAQDSGLTVWNSSQLTGLLTTAHSHGVKVVVTIIKQDFNPGTPDMCAALANRATTVSQTVTQVAAKGVDGVNIDYEGLGGTCANNNQSARAEMTNLASQLRTALPAGSYLSVDTYASSASDSLGFFDIPGLNAYVDSFFVMAYDLEYSNYNRAPLTCVSFCLGPTAPLGGYYYNDTSTASQYTSVVAASKVILGVPYYGRKACVASPTANQYPTGTVTADTYLDAIGEAGQPEVQSGSYVVHRDANDPAGQERWDTWYNTTLACYRELYWDDTVSLGLKYDLVNKDGLRGVGIFNLNYGGGAPELWSTLASRFGWIASYDLSGVPTSWVTGQSQTFNVTVTNTGDVTWPSTGYTEVDLDLHFTTVTGGSAQESHWLTSQAFSLPNDVAPGASVPVNVTVTAPTTTGSVFLEAEMIKEHQFWFSQVASVSVNVAAPVWSAGYNLSSAPTTWTAGQSQTFNVTVTNTGNTTWPHTGYTEVDLDLHFTTVTGGSTQESQWLTSQAFALPSDVAPTTSATFAVTVTPPNSTGSMFLEAEMIKEHQFWFSQVASVSVNVAAPVWSAGYNLSGVPTSWVAGQSQTFNVTVTNTGNVTWPSSGYYEVDLDLHFTTVTGGSTQEPHWLTSQAFSLPNDVAPSASVTVSITVTVPTTTGSMFLEAEMIKEHQFWFSQVASVSVNVAAPVWSAGYNLSSVPTTWTAGQSQTFNVTVTNTGNTTWPHTGYTEVDVDFHFTTVTGGSTQESHWLTSQAFSVPNDVAPGASVTFTVTVTAPTTRGSMFLEAEMIKEHQFWFTSVANVSVTVA
jgi:spore germination protein YaaH